MASDIGIVNSALLKIGASKTIVSLTDDTPNAIKANAIFDIVRDALVRGGGWNFATTRVQLAQSTTIPAFDYDFAYPLPADWLRTLRVYDNDAGGGTVEYRIEGTSILSYATEIWLLYLRRVTDPNVMTADFRELLSLKLAVELAIPVANSKSLRSELLREFKRERRTVGTASAIEDFADRFPDGSWLTTRQRTEDDEFWNR